MPRNASGTYSLPSGNPVSSGTLIDANWANNTLNDLANEVTDSLSRSAEGGMLAPLRLTDGVQATPSLAFTNEPSSGLYRAGTNDAWFVSGGNQVMQFTSSGVVGRLAAGAVGTPSLTFFGDLNTGLWSPAADTLAASTGGSERLRVDSSGNVGIGTASPGYKLDVNTTGGSAATARLIGNDQVNVRLRLTNTGSGGRSWELVGGYPGANNANFSIFDATASTIPFTIEAAAPTNAMLLNASGNLGIGTASPLNRLVVSNGSSENFEFNPGSVALNGGAIEYINRATATTRPDFNFYIGTNGSHKFYTNGTERARIDGSGNLGIGTASPAEHLHINGSGNQRTLVESTSASGVAVSTQYKTATRTWEVGNGPGLGDNTFSIVDGSTVRFNITATGNTVTGTPGVALATNATNGFLYVPTCAGTPTGTPTAITGFAPIVVNTTNNKLYFYSGGAWRDAGP